MVKRTINEVKKSAGQQTKLNPFELKYNRAKHKVYFTKINYDSFKGFKFDS